ncbi:MAG: NUDIX hydrolase [bacterium]
MYKIFVGDKPIILTSKVEPETHFKNYLIDTVPIHKVIRELKKDHISEVRFIGKNEDKLLKKFLKKLPVVTAGGGKVYNQDGKVLFIYRNDKWDLPKGRIEKGEAIEEGAKREVTEETGVKDLKIQKPLEKTYHIFKRNNRYRIKVTHWYKMTSAYDGELIPQTKEGITKVKWLNEKKITKALKNSYANIKSLV